MSLRDGLVAGAALVAALVVADRCHQADRAEWERDRARVQEQARHSVASIAEALREAHERGARADSIVRVIERRDTVLQARIDTVRAETPDSLADHPAIVRRDEIIDSLVVQTDRWRDAFEEERAAKLRLMAELDSARVTIDSLGRVLEDAPGDRPWYLPKLGVGPFAGLCTDSRPCAGVGANVSWDVSL